MSINAVTLGASGTLYAADTFGIVFRSDDGGTWTPISCGGVVLSLYPLPDGTVVGGTDGFGLVRTVNDGWSWEYAGGTETVPSVRGDASGRTFAIAARDGLRTSTDGGASWDALRWVDADVPHLAALPGGPVVAVSGRYYGAHALAGDTWSDLGLDRESVYEVMTHEGVLVASMQEGQFGTAVKRSDDGGATWAHVHSFPYYTTLSMGDAGRIFARTSEASLYSDDGGATWAHVPSAPFPNGVHHAGEGLLFSLTGGYPDALLRSTDNGLSWTNLGSPTFDEDLVLPRIQATGRVPDGALLAADRERLMRSTDDGLTWDALDDSPAHVVAFAQEASGTLWAATSEGYTGPDAARGIWRSDDDGLSWTASGLDGLRVRALAIAQSGTLVAGTDAGVYTRSATTTAGEPTADLPEGYALSAVYPNPFNPTAQFTLDVAEAQSVTVAVFDALGRRVAVLHDGPLAAGTQHAFSLDAAALPSGVYVVRAAGETFTVTRRATLLK